MLLIKKSITREEFAEVLKAYNLGITTGTSATTFGQNALLKRVIIATRMIKNLK